MSRFCWRVDSGKKTRGRKMSKDVKIRDCSNIFGEGGPFQPGMANGNRKEAKGNPKVKRESKFKGTGSKGGHATGRYCAATSKKEKK